MTAETIASRRPSAVDDDPASRPVVTLLPGGHRRAEGGHPWIYSNEVQMDAAAKALAPGTLVTLRRADGRPLGVAMFNPHTLLAARLLDRDAGAADRPAVSRAPAGARAASCASGSTATPYYRLVHAEADGLPGPRHRPFRRGAGRAEQRRRHGPAAAGRDRGARRAAHAARRSCCATTARRASSKGCRSEMRVALGAVDGPGAGRGERRRICGRRAGRAEDRLVFRPARQPRFCRRAGAGGARVLDLYCYSGGFAVAAARARRGVGRSGSTARKRALALAAAGGRAQRRRRASASSAAPRSLPKPRALAAAGERFDIVIADPPAFARSQARRAGGAARLPQAGAARRRR